MALNALGALLAAIEIGAHADAVLDGLAGFEGVRRRFELVGTANGVRVFDDYAHHPTEVRATLAAVRTVARAGRARSAGPSSCFSPTCIRGQRLSPREFGQALDAADEVFVLDVYAAREQPMAGVSGAQRRRARQRAGALRARLLRGGRTGGRGGRPRRRRRHDGCRRRHDARPGDPDGAAGEGQPQRAGRGRGRAIRDDRAEPTATDGPTPSADGRRAREATLPIAAGRSRLRGSATTGASGTRGAPRRPGPRDRDRAGPPRGQAPRHGRAAGRAENAWRAARFGA